MYIFFFRTASVYLIFTSSRLFLSTNSGVFPVDMRLVGLKRSPPPSPVSVVWSLDFGSLHFSQTAWTGASPAGQDQPWNPGSASEWLSGPAQHTHTHTVIQATHKQQCTVIGVVFPPQHTVPSCAAAAVC